MKRLHKTKISPVFARFLLAMMAMLYLTMLVPMTAHAAGGFSVKDIFWVTSTENGQNTTKGLPGWSELVAKSELAIDAATMTETEIAKINRAANIVETFKTSSAYDSATSKVKKAVVYDESIGDIVPVSDTTRGQQDFARAISHFNQQTGSKIAADAAGGIFDTESFRPDAGFATPFLDGFYMVVNTIFYVVSNVVIWWFLAQTSFDMLYIMCEPLRPYIGPLASNVNPSGGGGGVGYGMSNDASGFNPSKVMKKAISMLHLCSDDVAKACGSGSMNSGMGGNDAGSTNPWVRYFKSRAPVVVAVCAYLMLVSMGWWPKVIAWVAGWVTRLLGLFIA